jgi:stringent starvation protein B
MQQVAPELNMTRAIMNTMIQWFVDMDMSRRIHIITDARMFDVGLLEPEINGLYQIRLNIAANATRNFRYNEDNFSFQCGYNGADVYLEVPYEAVLGFAVPTTENYESILPIPNFERELLGVKQMQDLHKMFEEEGIPQLNAFEGGGTFPGSAQDTTPPPFKAAKAIEDSPYAVHGVEIATHDEEGNKLPTNVELMRRKPLAQRPAKPVAKEQPAPLLNFGNVNGTQLPAAKVKRTIPNNWRVIEGGKA